jgi:ribulose kinase
MNIGRLLYLKKQLAEIRPRAVAFDEEMDYLADKHQGQFEKSYCNRIRNQKNPHTERLISIEREIERLESTRGVLWEVEK